MRIYIYFFNFTNPLRCLRVPPGVRVPEVEYHWASVYRGYILCCRFDALGCNATIYVFVKILKLKIVNIS
jgi:hypothetical protein